MKLQLGVALSRAAEILWRHKVLWIFGILAGCSSSGGNFNFNVSTNDATGQLDLPPEVNRWLEQNQEQLVLIGVGLVCASLLLSLLFFVIQAYGKAGLIAGVLSADRGEAVSFGSLHPAATGRMWALVRISILLALPVILLVVIFAAALAVIIGGAVASGSGEAAALGAVGGLVACIIPFLCLMIPLGIVVSGLNALADQAAVQEQLGARASIGRAWASLTGSIVDWLVLGLILIVIGAVIGFVVALPLGLSAILTGVGAAIGASQDSLLAGLIPGLLCFGLYLPVMLLLNGIVIAWMTGTVTLSYKQLQGGAAPAAGQAA